MARFRLRLQPSRAQGLGRGIDPRHSPDEPAAVKLPEIRQGEVGAGYSTTTGRIQPIPSDFILSRAERGSPIVGT